MVGDIIILHQCTKNYNQMMFGCRVMTWDIQMKGQTEKVTYRVPHLKNNKGAKRQKKNWVNTKT